MSFRAWLEDNRYYLERQYYGWLDRPAHERGSWWAENRIDSLEAYARYEYNAEADANGY